MRSLPRFSVENPVLVNMLMFAILIGGTYCGLTLVREMFPESRPTQVAITTPYPGATPPGRLRAQALNALFTRSQKPGSSTSGSGAGSSTSRRRSNSSRSSFDSFVGVQTSIRTI